MKNIIVYYYRKCVDSFFFNSGILAHRSRVNWANVKSIKCEPQDVKIMYNCSSILYFIDNAWVKGYFRPIYPHKSVDNSVRDAVKIYFDKIHPEQVIEKECIEKTISDGKSFGLLMKVGNYSDPYSLARKFYLTKDTTIVGITPPEKFTKYTEEWKAFVLNIDHFLKFVMNTISRHVRNRCGGGLEFASANRQMATETMARLLGLDYMIPHSEYAILKMNNDLLKGTIMEVADGESTEGITKNHSDNVVSPALQRELMNLNVLDAITFERDHRPGNYNIILDGEGKVSGLSVFDNDAPMTFAPLPLSMFTGSATSKMIGPDGLFNRPHLDRQLADRICSLKKKEVLTCLKPFLNILQIYSCWNRIKDLRKVIKKTSIISDDFLFDPCEWSMDSVQEELSGKYGITYLKKFVDNEVLNKSIIDYYSAAPL